jgi:hypothetical protein
MNELDELTPWHQFEGEIFHDEDDDSKSWVGVWCHCGEIPFNKL